MITIIFTKIGLFWGVLEPLLFIFPIINRYLKKDRIQVNEKQLNLIFEKEYSDCIYWLETNALHDEYDNKKATQHQ